MSAESLQNHDQGLIPQDQSKWLVSSIIHPPVTAEGLKPFLIPSEDYTCASAPDDRMISEFGYGYSAIAGDLFINCGYTEYSDLEIVMGAVPYPKRTRTIYDVFREAKEKRPLLLACTAIASELGSIATFATMAYVNSGGDAAAAVRSGFATSIAIPGLLLSGGTLQSLRINLKNNTRMRRNKAALSGSPSKIEIGRYERIDNTFNEGINTPIARFVKDSLFNDPNPKELWQGVLLPFVDSIKDINAEIEVLNENIDRLYAIKRFAGIDAEGDSEKRDTLIAKKNALLVSATNQLETVVTVARERIRYKEFEKITSESITSVDQNMKPEGHVLYQAVIDAARTRYIEAGEIPLEETKKLIADARKMALVVETPKQAKVIMAALVEKYGATNKREGFTFPELDFEQLQIETNS